MSAASSTTTTTTTTTTNDYSVDRSAALAQLQSTYGMTGHGYRIPFSVAVDAASTSSDSDSDSKSFMTSSVSSSSASTLSSSSSFSLKARAASFLKLHGSRRSKVLETTSDSTATLVDGPVLRTVKQEKPDPSIVFAHLSAQYGIGSPGAGFKLPNLESDDHKTGKKSKDKKSKKSIPAPAPGSPEAVLADLMDRYGAPGGSQARGHI
ncbi:hypothetical protein A4X09_0g3070 [Tilletia walkeri]|uniref:Uncharacterized protein n=1 Tax=Tilletia walkeri TaxID=117179 RepID=A0A8X7NA80_9BASI|nr:hypothetical protein A4X09_0g3070 [Tilletia walkeri]